MHAGELKAANHGLALGASPETERHGVPRLQLANQPAHRKREALSAGFCKDVNLQDNLAVEHHGKVTMASCIPEDFRKMQSDAPCACAGHLHAVQKGAERACCIPVGLVQRPERQRRVFNGNVEVCDGRVLEASHNNARRVSLVAGPKVAEVIHKVAAAGVDANDIFAHAEVDRR